MCYKHNLKQVCWAMGAVKKMLSAENVFCQLNRANTNEKILSLYAKRELNA